MDLSVIVELRDTLINLRTGDNHICLHEVFNEEGKTIRVRISEYPVLVCNICGHHKFTSSEINEAFADWLKTI